MRWVADILPQDSNVYDVAIVLILAVMGYAQLRLKSQQAEAKAQAGRAAVKAEATQQALPDHQREKAKQREHELLNNGVGEEFKKVAGYYP